MSITNTPTMNKAGGVSFNSPTTNGQNAGSSAQPAYEEAPKKDKRDIGAGSATPPAHQEESTRNTRSIVDDALNFVGNTPGVKAIKLAGTILDEPGSLQDKGEKLIKELWGLESEAIKDALKFLYSRSGFKNVPEIVGGIMNEIKNDPVGFLRSRTFLGLVDKIRDDLAGKGTNYPVLKAFGEVPLAGLLANTTRAIKAANDGNTREAEEAGKDALIELVTLLAPSGKGAKGASTAVKSAEEGAGTVVKSAEREAGTAVKGAENEAGTAVKSAENEAGASAKDATNSMLQRYRVDQPQGATAPDKNGIIFSANGDRYISIDNQHYPATFNKDYQSWEIYNRDNPTKPHIAVEHQDGTWQLRDDLGLKGGMFGRVAAAAGTGLAGYAAQKLHEYKTREAAGTLPGGRNPIFDGRSGSEILQGQTNKLNDKTPTLSEAMQRKVEGMGETARNLGQTAWGVAKGDITGEDARNTFRTTTQGLQTAADLTKLQFDPKKQEKTQEIFQAGAQGAASQAVQSVWNAPSTLWNATQKAYSVGKATATTDAEDVNKLADAFGNKLKHDAMNTGGTALGVKVISSGLKAVPHPIAKGLGYGLDVLNTANTGANIARHTEAFELPNVNTIEGAGLKSANQKLHDLVNEKKT